MSEISHSRSQDDIKKLIKNSVLLNPQIQDDFANIDGYNDLIASYFKILKKQEQQKEELEQRRALMALENRKDRAPLTLKTLVYLPFTKGIKKEKYSIKEQGIQDVRTYMEKMGM